MDPPTTPITRRSPKWRRCKRWIVGLLATPVIALLALLATQRWWLPALVQPSVLKLTGLEAGAGDMRLSWRGGIRATNFKMRSPGESGEPTVSAARVDASLNWRRLLRGRLALRDIVLTEPTIRISADAEGVPAGEDAIEQARRGLRAFDSLPEVEIIDGTIEFVGQGSAGPKVLVAVSGGGTLRREAGDHARYTVNLRQTGAGDAIAIDGWIDLTDRTAELQTGELDLSRWIDSFIMPENAEFWRSIVTGGRLVSAQVHYAPDTGVISNMNVDGVRLALPMPGAAPGGDERMVLDAVSGRVLVRGAAIEASVEGLVDGLPTAATIEADGLSLNAPFRCSFTGGPFLIDRSWKPLALASNDVHSILHDFSGPSAEITARVDLSREAPSLTAETGIGVTGEVRLKHGSAAFYAFPYPVREIEGVVTFDDESIRIERLTGVGPTGAQLSATGVVHPDPNGVGLELTIHGEQAPVDEVLLDALVGAERSIVESLFDTSRHATLAAEGVIATAAQKREAEEAIERLGADLVEARARNDAAHADSLRAAISDLRRVADRPTFELGGFATADIEIVRAAGRNQLRRLSVDARVDRAGVLYSMFPYPVFIEPLVIHIDNDSVDVIEAPLVGMTGAQGEISGSVEYRSASAWPNLSIRFTEMPIDEHLLGAVSLVTEDHAKSAPVRTAEGGSSGAPAGEILRGLGAGGVISGGAEIQRDTDGPVRWNVVAELAGLELKPRPSREDRALTIDSFGGSLLVNAEAWGVQDGVASINGAPVRFTIDNTFENGGAISAAFSAPAVGTESPVEDLIRVFDADTATTISEARDRADLSGSVAITGDASFGDGIESSRIEISGAGELALTMDERTSRLKPRAGRVVLEGDVVHIDDLSIELLDHLGASSGVVELGGELAVGREGSLALSAQNLAIETPLVREAIRSLHPNLAMWFDEASPAGRLNVDATIARGEGGDWRATAARAEPKSLRFVAGAERIAIDQISGAITLNGAGGAIKNLRARAQDWSVDIDGVWFSGGTPGAQLTLSARGERLSDDILALLPTDVRDLFESLEIDINGGFELQEGSLAINAPVEGEDLGDGFRDGIQFSGVVFCNDASINAGVLFTGIHGSISIDAERAPYSTETTVDVGMTLDSLRAARLTVRDVTASIRSATDRDRTLAVRLLGESHGGRIWGDGAIHVPDRATAERGRYEFDLRLTGLDLATAMHEFANVGDGAAGPDIGERGFVDASLVFAGDLENGALPRGAGQIRILGGELVRLPLVMTILELGNVLPPIGERLDYARADFSLADGVAEFDRLLAMSPSIALVGDGSMTLPGFGLDLRFGTSGNRRLPLFSAIFDVLRNELLTTRVEGTLAEPQFSVVQLSGTRRLLSSLFGGDGGRDADDDAEPAVASASEKPD